MAESKTISVVIPCYNYGRFLGRAIDSVLAQTHKPDEVIVVDDGSTDQTSQIARGYGSKIRYVHQTNRGASSARNRGVRESKGEWIAFLDADDRWAPQKLAVQMDVLKTYPNLDAVVTNFRHEDDEGRQIDQALERHRRGVEIVAWERRRSPEVWIVGNHFVEALLEQYFIGLPTLIVRRSVFEKLGGFDEKFPTAEDLDFFLRLFKQGHRLGLIPDPLATVVEHGKSLCRQNFETTANLLAVLEQFERNCTLTPSEADRVGEYKSRYQLGLAWQLFGLGRYPQARRYAARVFRQGSRWKGAKAWLRTLPVLRTL